MLRDPFQTSRKITIVTHPTPRKRVGRRERITRIFFSLLACFVIVVVFLTLIVQEYARLWLIR
jgi:hypothetical protein